MPSGRFDFYAEQAVPVHPPVLRVAPPPQRGSRWLPAVQTGPDQLRRPRAWRAPACSHFRNLSAPSRTHPPCFYAAPPAFAPGHPRRAVSAPVVRAAPSSRFASAAVGDPSIRGE